MFLVYCLGNWIDKYLKIITPIKFLMYEPLVKLEFCKNLNVKLVKEPSGVPDKFVHSHSPSSTMVFTTSLSQPAFAFGLAGLG